MLRTSIDIVIISLLVLAFALAGSVQATAAPSKTGKSKYSLYWPPQLNNYYPDLELVSISGKKVRLSDYAGKVMLIEPIGMSCPACQAFAGAGSRGGYRGVVPQAGLPSIDSLLSQSGISQTDSKLIRVQLLLYNPSMQEPSLAEAKDWARHFGFGSRPNELVLLGDARFINNASYNMIPGFQVVDTHFVLRSDSTGHQPKNDLYKHLIPMLKSALQ